MKIKRQAKIMEIISAMDIETQEQLLEELQKSGFKSKMCIRDRERTNIRYVTPEDLGEALDLSVIDVSFISLHIVLPAVQKLLKPEGQVLCLIKPQFCLLYTSRCV